MARRFLCLLLASLVALASMPLCAESSPLALVPPFEDSVVYPVPGHLLNRWREASIAQDESLRKADEAVKTSLTSFERYRHERTLKEIVFGAVLFLTGAAIARSVR